MQYKIYLVDDHPVVRRGYAAIINGSTGMKVCGEASSGREALGEIPECEPDLVVVDVAMEEMSGIELIKHLRAQQCDVPVLVISVHDEALYAERALEAGAMGYVKKAEADVVIVEAIRGILNGRLYLSDDMNTKLLRRSIGQDRGRNSPLDKLSDRELEVFEHLGRGLSTSQVADAMFISPKTVGTHRRQIQEKLNLETTAKLQQHAVLWVHQQNTGAVVEENGVDAAG